MEYGLEDGTCNGTVTSPLLSDVELLSYSHLLCVLSHAASILRCWQVLHLVTPSCQIQIRFVFLLAFEFLFPT